MTPGETKWKIWSIEYKKWLKPMATGYTKKRESAGVFLFDQARNIVNSSNMFCINMVREAMVEATEVYKIKK